MIKLKKHPYLLIGMGLFILTLSAYHISKRDTLPDYIASSNGRIEAQSMAVATRSSGRLLKIHVQEGDMVNEGDLIATLDLNYLEAALKGAQFQARAAQEQAQEAQAGIEQAQATLKFAEKEHARSGHLVHEGAVSQSQSDQTLTQLHTAQAALSAAKKRYDASKSSAQVAQAEVERQKDLFSDSHLKAPKAGRVLYKLAEPGEILPIGGQVATLLDLTDVYMTVFFPVQVIGKLKIGDEARIVLDSIPNHILPAYISYISPEAQFTPRQVETKTEREKLTFRIKAQIPSKLLSNNTSSFKTGLPGVVYIRTENSKAWPHFLMSVNANLNGFEK